MVFGQFYNKLDSAYILKTHDQYINLQISIKFENNNKMNLKL